MKAQVRKNSGIQFFTVEEDKRDPGQHTGNLVVKAGNSGRIF